LQVYPGQYIFGFPSFFFPLFIPQLLSLKEIRDLRNDVWIFEVGGVKPTDCLAGIYLDNHSRPCRRWRQFGVRVGRAGKSNRVQWHAQGTRNSS
jgi:hypothetical protein